MLSSFEKKFWKSYIDFAIFKFWKKLVKVSDSTFHKKWVKFWKFFGKIFFEKNTTVYKAAYSKLDDLYNLVTKYVTKYAVLTTSKILKITKKSPIFEKKFEELATKFFFQKIGDVFFCNFENFESC